MVVIFLYHFYGRMGDKANYSYIMLYTVIKYRWVLNQLTTGVFCFILITSSPYFGPDPSIGEFQVVSVSYHRATKNHPKLIINNFTIDTYPIFWVPSKFYYDIIITPIYY